jgi:hypothetical protein
MPLQGHRKPKCRPGHEPVQWHQSEQVPSLPLFLFFIINIFTCFIIAFHYFNMGGVQFAWSLTYKTATSGLLLEIFEYTAAGPWGKLSSLIEDSDQCCSTAANV